MRFAGWPRDSALFHRANEFVAIGKAMLGFSTALGKSRLTRLVELSQTAQQNSVMMLANQHGTTPTR
jgi:hypothetical protein